MTSDVTDDKAQVPFWQRRFTAVRLREGYTMGEVDAFVERARVAYLTGDGSVTPKDVQQVRFTPVRLREGYDMGEVDETLDEVHALLRDRADGPAAPVAPAATPHLPTGTPPAASWTYPAQPAPRPGDGEAAELADHLDALRAGVLGVVMAMPADVRSTVRLPEGRSPLALLQHLEQVERRWFLTGFLGEQPGPDPAGATPGPAAGGPDGAAVARLGADLLRTGERTRSVLTSYPLTARASSGGAFVGDPPTLRAIATQALAGHARLAGQLDVVAELAGGRPG